MNRRLLSKYGLMTAMTAIAVGILWWKVTPPKPAPIDFGTGKLLVETRDGCVWLLNADGSDRRLVLTQTPGEELWRLKLSPDRKRVLYAVETSAESVRAVTFREEHHVRVLDMERNETTDLLTVQGRPRELFWTPDGSAVYGSGTDEEAEKSETEKGRRHWVNWRVDLDTKQYTHLDIPDEYRVWGFTPNDGRLICVRNLPPVQRESGNSDRPEETVTTPLERFAPEVVIPAGVEISPLAPFPDGRRWVVRVGARFGVYTQGEHEAKAWDWAVKFPGRAVVSPNGNRVIVTYAPFAQFDEYTGLRSYLPDGTGGVQVCDSRSWVSSVDWR